MAPNVVSFANSALIVELAAKYRMPSIYPFAYFARQGGLISYGFDERDSPAGRDLRRQDLAGANLAELPVQHPMKFEIVINLKTAKALGIDVPLHIQQLPDLVINETDRGLAGRAHPRIAAEQQRPIGQREAEEGSHPRERGDVQQQIALCGVDHGADARGRSDDDRRVDGLRAD